MSTATHTIGILIAAPEWSQIGSTMACQIARLFLAKFPTFVYDHPLLLFLTALSSLTRVRQ